MGQRMTVDRQASATHKNKSELDLSCSAKTSSVWGHFITRNKSRRHPENSEIPVITPSRSSPGLLSWDRQPNGLLLRFFSNAEVFSTLSHDVLQACKWQIVNYRASEKLIIMIMDHESQVSPVYHSFTFIDMYKVNTSNSCTAQSSGRIN